MFYLPAPWQKLWEIKAHKGIFTRGSACPFQGKNAVQAQAEAWGETQPWTLSYLNREAQNWAHEGQHQVLDIHKVSEQMGLGWALRHSSNEARVPALH